MLRAAIVPLVTAIAVAGCSSNTPPSSFSEDQEIKMVMNRLDEKAVLAVNAQRELALAADAKVRRESNNRQKFLTDRITYDFYGDIEQVLGDFANTYDYSFKTRGNRPIEGVLVNVVAKDRPALDVLKQIGNASPYVDIRLTDADIILYYKDEIVRARRTRN